MPIDQNDMTKIFVESVKNLVESGEIETYQEIASNIGLHRNALHLILKGERNVPPPKFKKFREVYMPQQNAPKMQVVKDEPVDYKEKYIALLEKTVEDQDKTNQALKGELEKIRKQIKNFEEQAMANFVEYQEDATGRMAMLHAIQRNLTEHRKIREKVSLEDLQNFCRKVLAEETKKLLGQQADKS